MAASAPREKKLRLGSAETSITQLFRLDKRTILVTGGGGSMGLEVAGAIVELGGDVICIDRAAEPLPDLNAKVHAKAKEHNARVWYYSCDITKEMDVFSVFDEAMATTRYPFRGMVACAGISGGGTSVEFSTIQARQIIDVNIMGTFICCQAAGRELQKQNQPGSIVLIASMSGHGSNKGVDTAIYNASKSAVHQLTRSLAADWGSKVGMPSIRVNSISPGYIRTRMTQTDLLDPNCEEAWSADNMLYRLSEADEYRGSAVFLLSDTSSFVTGADLRVDGGHTAW